MKAMAEKESRRVDLSKEVRQWLPDHVPETCACPLKKSNDNKEMCPCHGQAAMHQLHCWGACNTVLCPLQVPLYPESTVQVKVDSTAASDWQGDLLAIGLYEDDISSEGRALLSHSSIPATQQCAFAASTRRTLWMYAVQLSCSVSTLAMSMCCRGGSSLLMLAHRM